MKRMLIVMALMLFVVGMAFADKNLVGRALPAVVPTGTPAVTEVLELLSTETIVEMTVDTAITTVSTGYFFITGNTAATYVTPTAANLMKFDVVVPASATAHTIFKGLVFERALGALSTAAGAGYVGITQTVTGSSSLFFLTEALDSEWFLRIQTKYTDKN